MMKLDFSSLPFLDPEDRAFNSSYNMLALILSHKPFMSVSPEKIDAYAQSLADYMLAHPDDKSAVKRFFEILSMFHRYGGHIPSVILEVTLKLINPQAETRGARGRPTGIEAKSDAMLDAVRVWAFRNGGMIRDEAIAIVSEMRHLDDSVIRKHYDKYKSRLPGQ